MATFSAVASSAPKFTIGIGVPRGRKRTSGRTTGRKSKGVLPKKNPAGGVAVPPPGRAGVSADSEARAFPAAPLADATNGGEPSLRAATTGPPVMGTAVPPGAAGVGDAATQPGEVKRNPFARAAHHAEGTARATNPFSVSELEKALPDAEGIPQMASHGVPKQTPMTPPPPPPGDSDTPGSWTSPPTSKGETTANGDGNGFTFSTPKTPAVARNFAFKTPKSVKHGVADGIPTPAPPSSAGSFSSTASPPSPPEPQDARRRVPARTTRAAAAEAAATSTPFMQHLASAAASSGVGVPSTVDAPTAPPAAPTEAPKPATQLPKKKDGAKGSRRQHGVRKGRSKHAGFAPTFVVPKVDAAASTAGSGVAAPPAPPAVAAAAEPTFAPPAAPVHAEAVPAAAQQATGDEPGHQWPKKSSADPQGETAAAATAAPSGSQRPSASRKQSRPRRRTRVVVKGGHKTMNAAAFNPTFSAKPMARAPPPAQPGAGSSDAPASATAVPPPFVFSDKAARGEGHPAVSNPFRAGPKGAGSSPKTTSSFTATGGAAPSPPPPQAPNGAAKMHASGEQAPAEQHRGPAPPKVAFGGLPVPADAKELSWGSGLGVPPALRPAAADATAGDASTAPGSPAPASGYGAAAKVKRPDPNVAQAEKHNKRGNRMFADAKYAAALAEYDAAFKANKLAKYSANRAACFMMLSQYKMAVSACDDALAVDPVYAKAHLRRGKALLKLGATSLAREAIEAAVEVAAGHASVSAAMNTRTEASPLLDQLSTYTYCITAAEKALRRSRGSRKSGLAQALRHINSALAHAPLDAEATLIKAKILWEQNETMLARRIAKSLLCTGLSGRRSVDSFAESDVQADETGLQRVSHTLQELAVLVARAEWHAGEVSSAQRIFTELKRLVNSDTRLIETEEAELNQYLRCKDRGNALFRSSSYDAAVKQYSEGLRRVPAATQTVLRAILHSNRAAARMAQGNFKAAVADCTAAIGCNEDHLKAWLRRARCRVRLGALVKAVNDFDHVIECLMDPSFTASVPTPLGDVLREKEEAQQKLLQKQREQQARRERERERERRRSPYEPGGSSARGSGSRQSHRQSGGSSGGSSSRNRSSQRNGRGGAGGPRGGRSWGPEWDEPNTASTTKDFYSVLGIAPSATDKEIKKAYHKAALKYHPDKTTAANRSAHTEKFKAINEAYKELSDPASRRAHDRERASSRGGSRGASRGGSSYTQSYGYEYDFGFSW